MPNIGVPAPFMRSIISKVARSIILYACPIWSEALSVGTIGMILSWMYRLSAIRQISGFSTVSNEVVLVLAKTTAISILADIFSSSRVSSTNNNNFKNGETKSFLVQMVVAMGEQFKGKM